MSDVVLFSHGKSPNEVKVIYRDDGSYCTVGDTRQIACTAAVTLYNTILAIAKLREELRLLRKQAELQSHAFYEQGHHLLADYERYKIQAIDEMQSKFDEEFYDVK